MVRVKREATRVQGDRDFVAQHSSQQNLGEIADVIIDNHVPLGETLLSFEGYPQKVRGTCNVLACFAINWLVMETIELGLKNSVEPPVWKNANTIGGDEHNEQGLKNYSLRLKAP